MKIKLVIPVILALLICNVGFAAHHEMAENPNEAVAVNWLKAQAMGKAETIAYVSEHFAEDGMIFGGRYVGFGFTWNPEDDSKMVIERIVPGSPASKVLRPGDEFIVVKGVRVNKRTMDKLSFRGKPGEPVKATIKRDGKRLNIEVERGIISNNYGKADLMANLESGDASNWSAELKVNEVVSKGSVVYVWTTRKDRDDKVDLPFEAHIVTRFFFNDAGQVEAIANLSEDRFVLEQTGYSISR